MNKGVKGLLVIAVVLCLVAMPVSAFGFSDFVSWFKSFFSGSPTGAQFVDPDGDGVDSSVDNCPDVYNPGQGDLDGDGEGDGCDALSSFYPSVIPQGATVSVNLTGVFSADAFFGISGSDASIQSQSLVNPYLISGAVSVPLNASVGTFDVYVVQNDSDVLIDAFAIVAGPFDPSSIVVLNTSPYIVNISTFDSVDKYSINITSAVLELVNNSTNETIFVNASSIVDPAGTFTISFSSVPAVGTFFPTLHLSVSSLSLSVQSVSVVSFSLPSFSPTAVPCIAFGAPACCPPAPGLPCIGADVCANTLTCLSPLTTTTFYPPSLSCGASSLCLLSNLPFSSMPACDATHIGAINAPCNGVCGAGIACTTPDYDCPLGGILRANPLTMEVFCQTECGDGVIEGTEECDPPGPAPHCASGVCGSGCMCAPVPSSSQGGGKTPHYTENLCIFSPPGDPCAEGAYSSKLSAGGNGFRSWMIALNKGFTPPKPNRYDLFSACSAQTGQDRSTIGQPVFEGPTYTRTAQELNIPNVDSDLRFLINLPPEYAEAFPEDAALFYRLQEEWLGMVSYDSILKLSPQRVDLCPPKEEKPAPVCTPSVECGANEATVSFGGDSCPSPINFECDQIPFVPDSPWWTPETSVLVGSECCPESFAPTSPWLPGPYPPYIPTEPEPYPPTTPTQPVPPSQPVPPTTPTTPTSETVPSQPVPGETACSVSCVNVGGGKVEFRYSGVCTDVSLPNPMAWNCGTMISPSGGAGNLRVANEMNRIMPACCSSPPPTEIDCPVHCENIGGGKVRFTYDKANCPAASIPSPLEWNCGTMISPSGGPGFTSNLPLANKMNSIMASCCTSTPPPTPECEVSCTPPPDAAGFVIFKQSPPGCAGPELKIKCGTIVSMVNTPVANQVNRKLGDCCGIPEDKLCKTNVKIECNTATNKIVKRVWSTRPGAETCIAERKTEFDCDTAKKIPGMLKDPVLLKEYNKCCVDKKVCQDDMFFTPCEFDPVCNGKFIPPQDLQQSPFWRWIGYEGKGTGKSNWFPAVDCPYNFPCEDKLPCDCDDMLAQFGPCDSFSLNSQANLFININAWAAKQFCCPCKPDDPCYTGPKKTKDVGVCQSGKTVCKAGKSSATPVKSIVPYTRACTYDTSKPGCVIYATGTSEAVACNSECIRYECATVSGVGELGGLIGSGGEVVMVDTCSSSTSSSVTAVCEDEVLPSAEICNGLDDDCDGLIDEDSPDDDADGVPDCGDCPGEYYDDDASVHPAWPPIFVPAIDEDLASSPPMLTGAQVLSTVSFTSRSSVLSASLSVSSGGIPAAPEICDGKDNNCNGVVDEGCACTPPGVKRPCTLVSPLLSSSVSLSTLFSSSKCVGTQTCVSGVWSSCVVPPVPELCNNIDDNCNGVVDEGCKPVPPSIPPLPPVIPPTVIPPVTPIIPPVTPSIPPTLTPPGLPDLEVPGQPPFIPVSNDCSYVQGLADVVVERGVDFPSSNIPDGYSLVDTLHVRNCDDALVSLTQDISNAWNGVEVIACEGDDCGTISSTRVTEDMTCAGLSLDDLLVPSLTARNNLLLPSDAIVRAGKELSVSDRVIESGKFRMEFSGNLPSGIVTLKRPDGAVDVHGLNSCLGLSGSPVVVGITVAESPMPVALTMPVAYLDNVDSSSYKIFALRDSEWVELGGYFDAEKGLIGVYIKDLTVFLDVNGEATFLVAGLTCHALRESCVVMHDGGNSEVNLVIHGLTSSVDTWWPLVQNAVFNKEPYDWVGYQYPHSDTIEEASEGFVDCLNSLGSYERINIIAHSAGGKIVLKGLDTMYRSSDVYTSIFKVDKAIMLGVPNLGVDIEGTRIFARVMSSVPGLARAFNRDSPILKELTSDSLEIIKPVPGVNFVAVAGTEGCEFTESLFAERSPREGVVGAAVALPEFVEDIVLANDCFISVSNALSVVENPIAKPSSLTGAVVASPATSSSCTNTFTPAVLHWKLNDAAEMRKLIMYLLNVEKAKLNPEVGFDGLNKYVSWDAVCNPNVKYAIVAKKGDLQLPLNCNCGNDVCEDSENAINCPQDCHSYSAFICAGLGTLATLLLSVFGVIFVIYMYRKYFADKKLSDRWNYVLVGIISSVIVLIALMLAICAGLPLKTILFALLLGGLYASEGLINRARVAWRRWH